ncbi:hypothetical protein LTS18_012189 [Coniosporium uncinatum]|uniref:Uncharacterized protein n=1 Tax=Coniosporium uncinatum TaxID=93489 RepID=A0ACC3DW72_9PEZI|nr:hypothetical protein LTS18_012189 [Coniosporium uncinatum]
MEQALEHYQSNCFGVRSSSSETPVFIPPDIQNPNQLRTMSSSNNNSSSSAKSSGGTKMSQSDAARVQSGQAKSGQDMSSSGFAARAQSAGDKNANQGGQSSNKK